MPPAAAPSLQNKDDASPLSNEELLGLVRTQATTIATLSEQLQGVQHQLEWFKRQFFGTKSERFAPEPNPAQMHLGQELTSISQPPEPCKEIPAHTRRAAKHDLENDAEARPFFDESRVPVQTITLTDRSIAGLSPDQFEVIGEKVSYRLAQRPGSYVVLKYVRPVIKRLDTQTLHCPPAPAGVLEGSRADVSFIVGLLIDKFAFHLPLYRQHQRLTDVGITVSRPWLTQLAQQSIALLEPIYEAQLASIRQSRVKAMDETPIKAGRSGHGKMKVTYFWPIYGERDEVCFPFHAAHNADVVRQALGLRHATDAVLLTDGNTTYDSYSKKTGLTHACCWAHSRRGFFEAQAADPQGAREALEQIQAFYAIEEQIRERKLVGESKQLYRLTYTKPKVDAFFKWVHHQFERQELTPSNPFTQALKYVRKRRLSLEVFLSDPDVPIDTNHLERALRVIPMGRKNWNFCWTELGARHVGIVQSLIVTCRLHDIDPYDYLVDVLQRISEHPATRVGELTPRLWKQHFASNPLRSDLDLSR